MTIQSIQNSCKDIFREYREVYEERTYYLPEHFTSSIVCKIQQLFLSAKKNPSKCQKIAKAFFDLSLPNLENAQTVRYIFKKISSILPPELQPTFQKIQTSYKKLRVNQDKLDRKLLENQIFNEVKDFSRDEKKIKKNKGIQL